MGNISRCRTVLAEPSVSESPSSTRGGDGSVAPFGVTRSFQQESSELMGRLTPRQIEVLDHVLAGQASKNIAFDLHISQRTVENHRAAIARLLGTCSLPELVRVATCGRCDVRNDSNGCTETFGLKSHDLGCAESKLSHGHRVKISTVHRRLLPVSKDRAARLIDLKEVQHRFKNMVAIIQSMAHQTMRQCTSIADFDERFSARLSAYCRSLDSLISNDWRGMSIVELIGSQLATFGIDYSNQICIRGPDLELTSQAARNIGLALHELATNAVKYGALSVPAGRVDIAWSLVDRAGEKRFLMTWTEAEGPAVKKPTRRGFGRQIIERLAPSSLGGIAIYEFPSTGVNWAIDVPSAACLGVEEPSYVPDAISIQLNNNNWVNARPVDELSRYSPDKAVPVVTD